MIKKGLSWISKNILFPKDEKFKILLFWSVIFSSIRLIMHFSSGLLFGYEENSQPWLFILLVCLISEFARSTVAKLFIHRCKHKFILGITVAVVFAASNFLIFSGSSLELRERQLFCNVVIYLINSVLLTALAMGGFFPCALYALLTQTFTAAVPVITKMNWRLSFFLEVILCALFLIVLDCDFNAGKEKEKRKLSKKGNIIVSISAVIIFSLIVCFFCGILPIKPVAIATGSMEPKISVGDMVIVKDVDAEQIEVGDVIQFYRDYATVVHRVTEIQYSNYGPVFITKGDANNANDSGCVLSKDIIGKVVYKVSYLGYVALWLHSS